MLELTAAAADGGISTLQLLTLIAALVGTVLAVLQLPAQRQKLVGESLGDALEDLDRELTRVRGERDHARLAHEQVRQERDACRECLRRLQAGGPS